MKTVTLSARGRYLVVTFPPDDDIQKALRRAQRLHWKPGLGGWVSEVKDVMGLVAELRDLGLAVRYGQPVTRDRPRAFVPAPVRPEAPLPPDGIYFTPRNAQLPSFQEAYVARWRESQSLPALEPVDLASLDTSFDIPGFRGELYPFQKQAIAFLRKLGWCGILADEMGLGKTIMAIGAALLADERALVVAPAAVKDNWAAEVERFTGERARIWRGGVAEGPAGARFTIVNYDLLPRLVDRLNADGHGMVFLDEAHYVKNPRARRSQATFRLAMPKRVLLTGTPLLNRANELHPLLSFVQPGKWGTEREFHHHYARKVTKLATGGLTVDGVAAEHLRELRERLRGVMIRRQKVDVLKDLPPKSIEVQPIELPESAVPAYRALEDDLTDYLAKEGIDGAFRGHGWLRTLAKMHALKQFVIGARSARAVEWLRQQVAVDAPTAEPEKVVVFSQYLQPLHDLAREFPGEHVLIEGSVPSRERYERVQRFQNDARVRFAIGQIQAMGTGLNMTAARRVLFLDLAWTPAAHAQAMDRVHRIGQRRSVIVTFLVTPGTIDEHLQQVLLTKQAVINTVMGERQAVINEVAVLKRVAEALMKARA